MRRQDMGHKIRTTGVDADDAWERGIYLASDMMISFFHPVQSLLESTYGSKAAISPSGRGSEGTIAPSFMEEDCPPSPPRQLSFTYFNLVGGERAGMTCLCH